MLIPKCCKGCSNRNSGICNCVLPLYCNEFVEEDKIEDINTNITYVDMLNKESSELLVNSLAEKDQKIAELQKQLEASETQNKRVLEKLELITKSNQNLEKKLEEKEQYTYTGKEVGEIERKYETKLEDLRSIKAKELAGEVFDCATQLSEKEKELREIRVENYTIKSYRDFLDNKCKNLIKENKKLKQQLHSQPAEIVEKIKQELGFIINNKERVVCDGSMTGDKYILSVLDNLLKEYQK